MQAKNIIRTSGTILELLEEPKGYIFQTDVGMRLKVYSDRDGLKVGQKVYIVAEWLTKNIVKVI